MLSVTKGLVAWTLASLALPLVVVALGAALVAARVTVPESPLLNGALFWMIANAAFGTPLWALLSVPFCLRYWRRGLWWVAASIPLWLGAVALIVATTV